MTQLNHHSASLYAFHQDRGGRLHLLFERKSRTYNFPQFHLSLSGLGGNWQKGKDIDASPEEVVKREIGEEFWLLESKKESLTELYGQPHPEVQQPDLGITQLIAVNLRDIQSIGKILMEKTEHAADYQVTARPPVKKRPLHFGSSAYLKQLSSDEFEFMQKVFGYCCNGAVTTDNALHGAEGSRLEFIALDGMAQNPESFSWEHGHVLADLLQKEQLPSQKQQPIRNPLISVERMRYTGKPAFATFEEAGFSYKDFN